MSIPARNCSYEKLITVLTAIRRARRGVVVVLGPVVLATSVLVASPPRSGADAARPVTTGTDTLRWTACPAESPDDARLGLPRADVLCATAAVPVDHARPDGRTVDVLVRRITATDVRTGTVFGNPGGPRDARGHWNDAIDPDRISPLDELRRTHDLVIVQPRGLAGSGAISCRPAGVGPATVPVTTAAAACMDADPELVSSVTTENLVRDHEHVRRAMGLGPITFIGTSYGTAMGMAYQALFPDSIHRMVLDSSVGPSDMLWHDFYRVQMENRFRAREHLLEWIAGRDPEFGLGDTPLEVFRSIDTADRIQGRDPGRYLPPPARPGDQLIAGQPAALGPVTDGLIAAGAADPVLAGAARLGLAAAGSSDPLGAGTGRAPSFHLVLDDHSGYPGTWWTIVGQISRTIHSSGPAAPVAPEPDPARASTADGEVYAMLVNCTESATSTGDPMAGAILRAGPVTGATEDEMSALYVQTPYCPFPASAVLPRTVPNPMAAAPLILQSDLDPRTPAVLGPETAAATGGTLVRVQGTAHGTFNTGNPAVDAVVLDYLRTGAAPAGLHLDAPVP